LKQNYFAFHFLKRLFWLFYGPVILFALIFSLSAGFFWHWRLTEFVVFNLIIVIGCIIPIGISSYVLAKQYSFLLGRTYQLSSKFRFWKHDLDDVFTSNEDQDLFLEMDRALGRVRIKLLQSRKKLAHELEQAKALMRSLQDAVVTINLENECLYFNSLFATTFLEVDHIENFKHSKLLITQAIRSSVFLDSIEKVKNNKKSIQFEVSLMSKIDGVTRDYQVKMSPLFEEKDQHTLYGVLILFHDVTQYKSAERMRMQFVENASHELRTPLTSVKGYLDLAIQDLSDNDPVKNLLLIASSGVSRLVDLVNDLLDLSKLDKSPDLQLDWVDPMELTDRVFQVLSPISSNKNIQLRMTSDIQVIRVDERKMEQVLINLIANAIQYNPNGTIVTVTWFMNNSQPFLKVEDDGIGIPEQHWDKLFDRFYRVDESRSRSQGGTGLGLAIVKQLVEAHGAEISVQRPAHGRGSCFQIKFKSNATLNNQN
jgi:two-component system phosphate regulon sensor histidine kinase PhoR